MRAGRFFLFVILSGISTFGVQAAPIAYSIANDGNTLIRFDVTVPGAVTVIGNFSGATTSLAGMDFRAANGLLYGYDFVGNQIVTVNPANAATTLVSTISPNANSQVLGLDFNPVADRLRIVTALLGQNLRVNVDTGNTIVDSTLTYAPGDVNALFTPTIVDIAYTNNDTDPATATQLYYIEHERDVLATTGNPNAGVLNTVATLDTFPSSITGFDIFTAGLGQNVAYASFGNFLYTVDLASGASTFIGRIDANTPYGLAIDPQQVVPEPAMAALIASGLLLMGIALSRQRRRD